MQGPVGTGSTREGISVPRWLIAVIGVWVVGSTIAFAFLLGRESARDDERPRKDRPRGAVALAPLGQDRGGNSAERPRVRSARSTSRGDEDDGEVRLLTPGSDAARAYGHADRLDKAADAAERRREKSEALARAREDAADGSPRERVADPDEAAKDAMRERVQLYFDQLEAIDPVASKGEAKGIAGAALNGALRGQTEQLDELRQKYVDVESKVRAIRPPTPALEHHGKTLEVIRDGISFLDDIKDMTKNPMGAQEQLATITTRTQAMSARAKEVDALAERLQDEYGARTGISRKFMKAIGQ